MNAEQIFRMKESVKNGSPENRKEVEALCDLALLGVWTKEKVLPLLRKLPEGEMKLPPVAPATEATVTTIRTEVDKLFKECPQPESLPTV